MAEEEEEGVSAEAEIPIMDAEASAEDSAEPEIQAMAGVMAEVLGTLVSLGTGVAPPFRAETEAEEIPSSLAPEGAEVVPREAGTTEPLLSLQDTDTTTVSKAPKLTNA